MFKISVSWKREPPTQPSLFHYIKEKAEPSIWSDLDFSVLRHPIRFLKEEWRAPRTQASLFHYVLDERESAREIFTWQEFFRDLISGVRSPIFIPSVFSDLGTLESARQELRAKRMRAGLISVLSHLLLLSIAVFLFYQHVEPLPPNKDSIVFLNTPFVSPFDGTGPEGGGGGGGGKQEKTPPSGGRMPDTTKFQLTPPDPEDPKPLVPAEDLTAPNASVVMPIEILQNLSLPIGEVTAPPNALYSSGPGSGGGIGTGQGTGIGPGSGPGVGPGRGGGMGGGEGGGIGSGVGPYVVGGGVRPPTPIVQPLPPYTEEARKARVEGIVLLQAVVRKDGTVDSFKVIRGLGYGLEESAIKTIANKWRFKPGTLNGAAVDVMANIEVSFRLY